MRPMITRLSQFVLVLLLATASPVGAQVARVGLVASRWTFDEGTASQAPTVRPGVALSIGLDPVRRLSPQVSAVFVPEGHIDPGLIAFAAELRVLLVGSDAGLGAVMTLGGGLAELLAGNRQRVVGNCRAPCMFEGVSYRTGFNFMSTAGIGVLVPVGPDISLTPSASYVFLMGDRERVLERLGVGLLWRP
jgi:hypothetical protein